jgi:hypothetical protein
MEEPLRGREGKEKEKEKGREEEGRGEGKGREGRKGKGYEGYRGYSTVQFDDDNFFHRCKTCTWQSVFYRKPRVVRTQTQIFAELAKHN